MGLDMTFYRYSEGKKYFLQYFRKHSVLHDFLLKKYIQENPKKSIDDFNNIEYELSIEVMNSLIAFSKRRPMKRTHYKEELLWGESSNDSWDATLEDFLPKLKDAMKSGDRVTYEPCW